LSITWLLPVFAYLGTVTWIHMQIVIRKYTAGNNSPLGYSSHSERDLLQKTQGYLLM